MSFIDQLAAKANNATISTAAADTTAIIDKLEEVAEMSVPVTGILATDDAPGYRTYSLSVDGRTDAVRAVVTEDELRLYGWHHIRVGSRVSRRVFSQTRLLTDAKDLYESLVRLDAHRKAQRGGDAA